MDFKFDKDSGEDMQQNPSGEKKKQSALLVLLLILIGGFTYVYFFTGLIKPQESKKAAEAPATAEQTVKMPIPSREGEVVKPATTAPEKEEKTKAATPPPATVAAVPAAKPAPAQAKPATAPAAAVKSAPPVQAKPKEEPKKPEIPKTAEKKSAPTAVADKKDMKPQATKVEEKKNVADAKKVNVAEADKKTAATKDTAKKTGAEVQTVQNTPAKPASWTLFVGNYVLEEALSADMGRVRKAGLQPVIKASTRKKTSMNRLFVSEFNDRVAAQSAMDKLKRQTSDAFVMEQDGKFALYAGSYMQSESANAEKERLKAAGVSVTIKHSEIAIPSQILSVGPFKTKKEADSSLVKLKSEGLKATLAQK